MQPETLQKIYVGILSVFALALVLLTLLIGDPFRFRSGAEAADTPNAEVTPQSAVDSALPAQVVDSAPAPSIPFANPQPSGNELNEAAGSLFAQVPSESIPSGEGSGGGAAAFAPLTSAITGGKCLFIVNRSTMATGMHRREPIGTEGPFLADGNPVVAFFETATPDLQRREVTVRWVHETTGESFLTYSNAGESERWRTWVDHAFTVDKAGKWRVEIMDENRCLAAQLNFDLTPPGW